MRPPEPETKRALLPADGTRYPTPHVYEETLECVVRSDASNPRSQPVAAWEFIFKCTVTGRRRRWGIQRREWSN